MKKKGLLVTIEGIDGTGKSTQACLLLKLLKKKGVDCVQSREPTMGQWGRKIRENAMHKNSHLSAEEELELFVKDRKEHVQELILPSLEEGKVVILDRYYFSSIAYQGARGIDISLIRSRNEAFAPKPDVCFLLTLPPEVAWERISQREKDLDSFEKRENLLQYHQIFSELREDCIIRIDGSCSAEKIHEKIFDSLKKYF